MADKKDDKATGSASGSTTTSMKDKGSASAGTSVHEIGSPAIPGAAGKTETKGGSSAANDATMAGGTAGLGMGTSGFGASGATGSPPSSALGATSSGSTLSGAGSTAASRPMGSTAQGGTSHAGSSAGQGATGQGASSASSARSGSAGSDHATSHASASAGSRDDDARGEDLRRQANEMYGEASDWVRERYEQASQWASDQYDNRQDYARRGRSGASSTYRSAANFAQENPVLIGVIGLATGLLLGALLPRTRQEDRYIGEWSDEVRDQGMRYAAEALNQGREYARHAFEGEDESFARHESEFRAGGRGPGA